VFSWTYQGLDDMTPAHGAGPTELATVQRVGEQVLLGDDPDEPVLVVNHGKGDVAVPGQQRRRVLDRLPLCHHEYGWVMTWCARISTPRHQRLRTEKRGRDASTRPGDPVG
jgi:hypothetical protein